MNIQQIKNEIFRVNAEGFQTLALDFFRYQYQHNEIYQAYANLLHKTPQEVTTLEEIPYLPVSFFKSHTVLSAPASANMLHFESSTTTGQIPSKHVIADPLLYEQSFMSCFERFFGRVDEYCILGLLPSYLERGHSSLVYMVDKLIQQSGHPSSGFYLHNQSDLAELLHHLEQQKQKTLLFGVTYALLDFAEQYPMQLASTRIIETGGMKGRRETLRRSEVHQQLRCAFGLDPIFSEYGMTELLSQAYSLQHELFESPSWMRILVRELNDPLSVRALGKGAINIIDLANVHSCSFLATDDYGEVYPNGLFTVLGRIDHSEIRGCSLLTLQGD